ncbi:hypothetical protein Q1695_002270 [Nippostrongylus brasiliensis]|nr:hypothetical protein Q1695_002270 [Nippostrongylus brasiliensis]
MMEYDDVFKSPGSHEGKRAVHWERFDRGLRLWCRLLTAVVKTAFLTLQAIHACSLPPLSVQSDNQKRAELFWSSAPTDSHLPPTPHTLLPRLCHSSLCHD